MSRAPTIVLAGGGSGGHVYPALAIGEIAAGRRPGARLVFVGTRRGAEATIAPARGVETRFIAAETFRRSIPAFVGGLAAGTLQASRILRELDPDLVVGTGGYSSIHVIAAAALRRRLGGRGRPAIFIHEQNVVAGETNRAAALLADRIGTTFDSPVRGFPARKVRHVGYPVRAVAARGDAARLRASLGIGAGAFVVFAFGGSSGSRTVNRALAGALPSLLAEENLHVIHATGRYHGQGYDPAADTAARVAREAIAPERLARYHALGYTESIGDYYAAADLVVCRCGSGTLFELRSTAAPAVLLPKMDSVGRHQYHNALALAAQAGCPVIVEEQDPDEPRGVLAVPGAILADAVLGLARDRERLGRIARRLEETPPPDARARIGEVVEELLGKSTVDS